MLGHDNNRVPSPLVQAISEKYLKKYGKKDPNLYKKALSTLSRSFNYIPESSDLSNWTWTNGFSYTLWKMIGVGFDFGLRSNKQEALSYALGQFDATSGDPTPTFDNIDNDIQSYWVLGLSYSF